MFLLFAEPKYVDKEEINLDTLSVLYLLKVEFYFYRKYKSIIISKIIFYRKY